MKMLVEYLENAVQFEQIAADEKDPKLKAKFGSPGQLRILVLPSS